MLIKLRTTMTGTVCVEIHVNNSIQSKAVIYTFSLNSGNPKYYNIYITIYNCYMQQTSFFRL